MLLMIMLLLATEDDQPRPVVAHENTRKRNLTIEYIVFLSGSLVLLATVFYRCNLMRYYKQTIGTHTIAQTGLERDVKEEAVVG